MNIETAIFWGAVVIIIALAVTNPAGDTAVLGGITNLVTGTTNSLQKGVK